MRTLIRGHRAVAMLVVAMALFVKALVPAGYMVGTGTRFLTVQLCADGLSHKTTRIAIPADGTSQPDAGHGSGKMDAPCAFTALSMGSLAAADAPLLALAITFLLLLGFAPVQATARAASAHIRPPLRGPPVSI